MRKSLLVFFILLCRGSQGQQPFQLAPPLLDYNSGFFATAMNVSIRFNHPGAVIRYTLTGKEPGPKDAVYTKPLRITKTSVLKAKVFADGLLPSEMVTANFHKSGLPVRQMSFTSPHPSHATESSNILYDAIGGHPVYNNGQWLGYDGDTATFDVQLTKSSVVQKISLDLLKDEGSWIFLPEKVSVQYFDNSKREYVALPPATIAVSATASRECYQLDIPFTQTISTDRLRVIVYPLQKIPDWHAGKGHHAWLFVDEINVY